MIIAVVVVVVECGVRVVEIMEWRDRYIESSLVFHYVIRVRGRG